MTLEEPRYTYSEFCRLAGGVNVGTLHRWRQKGVRGVRLKCIRIGGKGFVLRRDAEAFLAQLNGEAAAPAPARRGRDAKADEELSRKGY